ncbi:ABC-type dipeptide/oligopeptide/nickel transport system, permease component (plasmid) [Ketogulonicigenium vulgare Y25]|uniref:ABC peptide transporter, permease component n=1 Tax=Ketogulonicigenium vulgare (strain WSH-001) TaxID=759362 RepID=F9YBJ2_KETVW|nr:ABC transporter permease [Ketogulonicigenium vulgare]ADO44306.1 ABC-type dipeptide/oligopeptide/nickel transport system, permease component [Ketogulonicigenium vulgare Y25]AEM42744.1 ABC peptide transporter, permease component [Ketogulonicigenium vulgare WSH-001]ALJ82808.1 peptide ABC transporter permease [Ketogulonicigenium vulgare]
MAILKFWAARLGQSAFVLWAAFTFSFVILYLLPSDPVSLLLGQDGAAGAPDAQTVAALNAEFGLDQGWIAQYFQRLGQFLTLDFGNSIQHRRPVTDLVAEVLPATLHLSLLALGLALVLGVALAVAASMTRMGWLRQVLQSIPPTILALPGFWIGLVLLQVFAFQLRWVPSLPNRGALSMILPVVTLALPTAAIIGQILTKSLLGTWRQPFVQVARARGLSQWDILHRHVARNAILPALTMAAIIFGNLLTGTIITETVFSRGGLGRLIERAVTQQDIPLVQFMVVFSAFVFVVINLLVDAAYPALDPRIRRPRAV